MAIGSSKSNLVHKAPPTNTLRLLVLLNHLMHMAPETPYDYWFLSKITLCIWLLKHLAAIGSPKSPYALWLLKTPYGAIGSSKSPNALGSSNTLWLLGSPKSPHAYGSSNTFRLLVPRNHISQFGLHRASFPEQPHSPAFQPKSQPFKILPHPAWLQGP
jgi:hypothetical protein